jgi:copper chaperone CopZ
VVRTETIQVDGIRCERCVHRLAAALRDHSGLEEARANLLGQVTLAWDDELTDRGALIERLARAGFRERGGAGTESTPDPAFR